MNNTDQDFYDELRGIDSRIERFATPDERRRKFLKGQVSGSEKGDKVVEGMSGKPLQRAAMFAGSVQTGRPASSVRQGVDKRMKREG